MNVEVALTFALLAVGPIFVLWGVYLATAKQTDAASHVVFATLTLVVVALAVLASTLEGAL